MRGGGLGGDGGLPVGLVHEHGAEVAHQVDDAENEAALQVEASRNTVSDMHQECLRCRHGIQYCIRSVCKQAAGAHPAEHGEVLAVQVVRHRVDGRQRMQIVPHLQVNAHGRLFLRTKQIRTKQNQCCFP